MGPIEEYSALVEATEPQKDGCGLPLTIMRSYFTASIFEQGGYIVVRQGELRCPRNYRSHHLIEN
jgi:hypothetical protein